MPRCKKCKEMLPPDMMWNQERCDFCEKSTKVLYNKEGQRFEKENVVKDYKILLDKLAESEKLRNHFIKGDDV